MKRILVFLVIIAFVFSGCNMSEKRKKEEIFELKDTEITLYFGDSQAMYVMPEKRIISVNKDASKEEYAKAVLNELIKGPVDENLYPTLPSGIKVLKTDIENKILYVDFSKEMHTNHWGGAAGENMTLLSLVNTMTEIEGIDEVFPSVEGNVLNIEHIIVDEPLQRQEDGIGGRE
jgi:germination protein M